MPNTATKILILVTVVNAFQVDNGITRFKISSYTWGPLCPDQAVFRGLDTQGPVLCGPEWPFTPRWHGPDPALC